MTCEVAVLNRMAVALAADSAVTHSVVSNGQRQISYATGANKIFQLSDSSPVGAMLFNNAALQDIPWELIIKSFRIALAGAVEPALAGYVSRLKDYIENNQSLFPPTHREKHFQNMAANSFLHLFRLALDENPGLRDPAQHALHPQELTAFVEKVTASEAALPLPSHFVAADVTDAVAQHGPWLAREITDFLSTNPEFQHLAAVIQDRDFADLAIESLYKSYRTHFDGNYTGIVIAGFGGDDYFPGYVELRYYGFLLNRLIVDDVSANAINHEIESLIQAFAKKSMVETFLTGFAPEVLSAVKRQYRQHVQNLVTTSSGGAAPSINFASDLDQSEKEFSNAWAQEVLRSHYGPLRGVISGLPPDQMAELAETLVMLESFKEKVTQRTQSVGGPIDVAVITRGEGLVWIKRKHYFSSELNPRYFVRQSRKP